MKKLLTIMTVCLLTLSSHAQQPRDTTPLTVREVYQDFKDGFSSFITTLEGPAKHTYHVYVRQYLIEGWVNMIISLSFLIISLILLFKMWKLSEWEADSPGNVWAIFFVVACVVFLGSFIWFCCSLGGEEVTKAFNPEYYAIDKIITTFHK